MNPSITLKERIISLDIIRGLALFGILFINVKAFQVITDNVQLPDYNGLNGMIESFIQIFVEKNSFPFFLFYLVWGFIFLPHVLKVAVISHAGVLPDAY